MAHAHLPIRSAAAAGILEDLLRPGLRLVICGTAPSTRSAEVGAYYAGPGNKFWRTIHAVGLTPHVFAPEEWRTLDALGIGLTDLAKAHFGMDKDLPPGSFDAPRLRMLMERHEPEALAFNGKTAAKAFLDHATVHYGRWAEQLGKTSIWVMPSTSGAASGVWSMEPWRELARAISAPRPQS